MLKKQNELIIHGRRFISSKQASALTGYTHDYIGQICRAGKIPGRLVGRTRFVEEEALLAYARNACLPIGMALGIDEIENQRKETDPCPSAESVVTRPLNVRKSDLSSLSDAWGEIEYAEEEEEVSLSAGNPCLSADKPVFSKTARTDSRLKQTSTCLPTRQVHGSNYLRGIGATLVGIVLIASGGYVFAMKGPVIAETLADVMYPITEKTSFLAASVSFENSDDKDDKDDKEKFSEQSLGIDSRSASPDAINEKLSSSVVISNDKESKESDKNYSLFNRESALGRVALFTYYAINGFFSQTQSVLVEGLTRPLAIERNTDRDMVSTQSPREPAFTDSVSDTLKKTAQKIIPSSTITFDTKEAKDTKDTGVTFIQTSTPAERQTTITRTIIQTPVINILGVSEDVMETRLNQLNNKLLSLIANVSSKSTSQSQNVFKAVSLSQKIDKLSNVTVSGVSGLTDSDIPNDITASNYLPLSGGTLTGILAITGAGTSTISNNLLVSGGLEVGGTCINCGSGGGFSGTDLTVSGNTILGDATSTDTIAINARFTGSLIPSIHNALDIGDGTNWLAWRTGYFGTSIGIGGTATSSATSLLSSGSYTIDAGSTLSLNTTNNQPITTGTGLTTLSGGASTTILSVTNTAYFGGTATTTIDQAGNVTIPGSLTLSSIGKDMLVSINSSGNITATSTPTAAYYLATSTTASVFPYASTTALSIATSASTTDLIVSSNFTLGQDTITDITGTGLTLSGSALVSTLGTSVTLTSEVDGILPVANGGTNASSIGSHMILTFNGTSIVASSTPTAAYYLATSTTASIFPYASTTAITSTGSAYFATTGGSVGIGTTSPWGILSVEMDTNTPSFVVSNEGSSSPAFYIGGVNQDGVIGIGTIGGTGRRLDVFDAANPQLRLSQTSSIYTDFQVAAATGDLTVSLYPGTSADDIFLIQPDGTIGVDLWVCEGATCPGLTINNGGNVIAENAFYFGNGMRIDQVVGTTTEIAIYGVTATTTPIIIFDEQ